MTESGLPPVPAGPKPTAPVSARAEEPNAQITGVPAELRDVRAILRLRGEVIRAEADGAVRVRTARGDIDVKLDRGETPPREGQKVDVEIRPGRPPEQASVRPARADSPAPRETLPSLPQAAKGQGSAEQVQRLLHTPVDVSLGTPQKARTITLTPPLGTNTIQTLPALPSVGSTVRLQPVTAAETALLTAAALPEIFFSTLAQEIDFQAQIIVLKAQDTVLSTTLNIKPQVAEFTQQQALMPVTTSVNAATIFQTAPSALTPPPRALEILPAPPPPTPAAPATQNMPAQTKTADGFFSLEALVRTLSLDAPKLADFYSPPVTNTLITAKLSTLPLLQHLATPAQSIALTPGAAALEARIESLRPPAPVLGLPEGTPERAARPPVTADTRPLILRDLKAAELAAVVETATPDKRPLLSVFLPGPAGGVQGFTLPFPVEEIAPGTQISLMPQTGLSAADAIIGATTVSAATLLAPGPWPLFDDLYQAVARIHPALVQTMSHMVPNPANTAEVTPAALFFIAALRAGDLSGWLGDRAIDALRREGRGNLLARLTQEGGLLSRLGAEPVSQDWRGLSLPLFWDNQFQKIALYYKQEQNEPGDDRQKGRQTRFLFDLALPGMGKVQLDGLSRPARLDLIVRTEQAFSQAVQMDMRRVYTKALENTALSGELAFQNQPDQWVTIQTGAKTFGVSA
jgi:hypothetical protein